MIETINTDVLQAGDLFEREWSVHRPLSWIRDFIDIHWPSAAQTTRLALFAEMAVRDLELRLQARLECSGEDYLRLFSELQNNRDARIRLREAEAEGRRREGNSRWVNGGAPLIPCVSGYEVERELGRGGMGVVYLARQVKANRRVALKMVLAGGLAGEEDLSRFRTEAEAIARLQHPNIVQVYEVGEYEGKPFFSLEFCPGGSLDRRMVDSPLEPEAAADMLEVLARAVHAAHQANVIHRDLKPANILISAEGHPKVADFGLAKKLDESGHTPYGLVMGTPSYMAPEQAKGSVEEIGPVTDVYALGAILYEMLTGRPPFRAASIMDTLKMVCETEPVPPSRSRSTVPRDLETICLKALDKQRNRRYPSAVALAEDLRRFRIGEPIWARRASVWERAWKWSRRRPTVVALIATVALLAAFTALWWTGAGRDQARAETLPLDESCLQVTVWRSDGLPYPLQSTLPLRSGDNMRITCTVRGELYPSLFWFDTEGRLRAPPLERENSGSRRSFHYPQRDASVELVGPPGTEVLLLCAREKNPVALVEVENLFMTGSPWPELPGDSLLRLNSSNVWMSGPRGPGKEVQPHERTVVARARKLRAALADRFDFVAVAFPHQK